MKTRKNATRGSYVMYALALGACLFLTGGMDAATAAGPIPVGKISDDAAHLGSPGKLAVDRQGTLYVIDSYKDSIRQFDGRGTYLGRIPFAHPAAVGVASDGKVYIGSNRDYSITIYKQGQLIGNFGSGKNEFLSIGEIAVDNSTGDVYVADTKAQVIRVYYGSGVPKGMIPGFHLPASVFVTDANLYVLDAPVVPCPQSVAIGKAVIPVANEVCTGWRIAILDKKGTVVRSITEAGADQMFRPVDLVVDKFENMYVADGYRKAILVYDRLGSFIGAMTSALDEIQYPAALAISYSGNLLVSASETHSILEVGLTGKLQAGPNSTLDFKSKTGATLSLSALGY